MMSWERGLMREGRLVPRLPAWKMRAMRFVLMKSAAYTMVKQKPALNLGARTTTVNRRSALCVPSKSENNDVHNKSSPLAYLCMPHTMSVGLSTSRNVTQ